LEKLKFTVETHGGREATTSRVEKKHVYLHSTVETNMLVLKDPN
jgi:hypothetical protein